MNDEVFWQLIDQARTAMIEDLAENMQALDSALRQLSPEELIAFKKRFTELHNQAYRWDLWAAAYIMGGGCSDDGFMDFRDWLISRGQSVYEAALINPDSLADIVDGEEEGQHEGYSYLVGRIIEELHPEYEKALFEQTSYKTIKFPSEPSGTAWEDDEETLAKLCPRLFAMYW
ncbi:TPA: DUF4240 domain-containing protein [Serratia fonticola]|uniref:DUF4240 domain-containing protein n=1 Tax=Serratia fonticola TaxID=47917 RepID=A0A0F7HED4_SERFO|nr:DUF4240 domain-containing protein [Serratia fonticola]AKG71409.1 hypothetical protein WN53_21040 [Serratia fonticola]CAI1762658.1 Uncharacterised protein [Serratia fonticola]CAI2029847.1 Uncharacterised protein [Serratia fonticola]VTR28937.1 Uncharacterised protein [Serratia fonticola]